MDLDTAMRRFGGTASYRQLLALGATRRSLDRAVRRGDLLRLRVGWYGLPSVDHATRAAVRAGGVVSCITLLGAKGVWVPPYGGLPHVALPRHASGRFRGQGVIVHWTASEGPRLDGADLVPAAIRQASRCFGRELAVAAADSALRTGVLNARDLHLLPAEVRRRVDPQSESGGESIVRQRLQALQLRIRAQVWIDGVGRVDFVVGDRVVIEVDGFAFHGSREAFERDRARDLALLAAGFLVIRVSQRQILDDWPRIERSLLAIVRADRHLWRGAAAHRAG